MCSCVKAFVILVLQRWLRSFFKTYVLALEMLHVWCIDKLLLLFIYRWNGWYFKWKRRKKCYFPKIWGLWLWSFTLYYSFKGFWGMTFLFKCINRSDLCAYFFKMHFLDVCFMICITAYNIWKTNSFHWLLIYLCWVSWFIIIRKLLQVHLEAKYGRSLLGWDSCRVLLIKW